MKQLLWVFDMLFLGSIISLSGYLTDCKNWAFITHTGASTFTLVITTFIFYIFGLYELGIIRKFLRCFIRLTVAIFISHLLVASLFYFLGHWNYPQPLFFTNLGLAILLLHPIRHKLIKLAVNKQHNKMLLIGYNESSKEIHGILKDEVVAVADDNTECEPKSNLEFCTLNSILETVSRLNISKIIVCETERLSDSVTQQLLQARVQGNAVTTMYAEYERKLRKIPVEHIKDQWFALESGFSIYSHQFTQRAKRLIDIIIALPLLFLSLPIMAVTALIIKIGDRGPAIFKQKRVGYGEKTFTLYKFRSMKITSELEGAQWAQKNDPRITPFGKFLRKSRIDELPQLWNILKGEMTLIGPRPEQPEFVQELDNLIPYYYLRHTVKPGLTGWAQINYPYGSTTEDAKQKLEYEIYYIKNMSILLDIKIVLKTAGVMIFGQGAR